MRSTSNKSRTRLKPALFGSLLLAAASPAFAATNQLIQPNVLVVDKSLPKAQLQAEILAARRYDTFWNNGDEALARAALAATFRDNTLPPGRPQGLSGPIAASRGFRGAVPDLRCDVEQMIVSGDRVVSHLRFNGHFTGTFKGTHGKGQPINFIATDIYQIGDGRITGNWHLEDNLTFLQQIGLISN
jgi:predicted ester cyclase